MLLCLLTHGNLIEEACMRFGRDNCNNIQERGSSQEGQPRTALRFLRDDLVLSGSNYYLASKRGSNFELTYFKRSLSTYMEWLEADKKFWQGPVMFDRDRVCRIEADMLLLAQLQSDINELETQMHEFFLDASKENARQLLKKLRASNAKLMSATLHEHYLDEMFNKSKNDLAIHFFAILPQKLEMLINLHEGKRSFRSRALRYCYQTFVQDQLDYKKIDQYECVKLPCDRYLEESVSGMCYGITLGISWDILSTGKESNLATVNALQQAMLQQIATCQRSQYRYLLFPDHIRSSPEQDIVNSMKIFVNQFDAQHMRSRQFAKYIATSVVGVLSGLDAKDLYALNLIMDPIYSDNGGHAMSIVYNHGIFYFIDSATAIYKFTNAHELQTFLESYLHIQGYSKVYSSFSLLNFPHMEHVFPTPNALASKFIPNEHVVTQTNTTYWGYFWDRLYAYGAIVTDLMEAMAAKLSCSKRVDPNQSQKK